MKKPSPYSALFAIAVLALSGVSASGAKDSLPPPSCERFVELQTAWFKSHLPLKRSEVFAAFGGIKRFRLSSVRDGKTGRIESYLVFDPDKTVGEYQVELAYRTGANSTFMDQVISVRFLYLSPYTGEPFYLEPPILLKETANKSPEATPGQRPPAAPSPSSGAPQL